MKIAVVSTGRSRCTLLARYLHTLHPDFEFCKEFYTLATWENKFNIIELTEELLSKENYIVKIMAMNLSEDYSVSDFKFEQYDHLHLAERYDFFEQCCSWIIARTHDLYHLHPNIPKSGYEEFDFLRRQQNKLKLEKIKEYAEYVDIYLKMKKYLIDNKLDFTVHTYEDINQFSNKQDAIKDSNLNYSKMITNYHLKDEVNALFNKHFSYENVTSDLESFNRELEGVKGLRSLGNFANKMTAKWSK